MDNNRIKNKIKEGHILDKEELNDFVEKEGQDFEQQENGAEKRVEKEDNRELRKEIQEEVREESGLEGFGGGATARQARKKEVEGILEEDLDEIYLKLNPDKQREFKEKGEETALKINQLLDKAKVKAKKVINLIIGWLSLIPGVNKFFLEQEAKIKVDKILKLKDK